MIEENKNALEVRTVFGLQRHKNISNLYGKELVFIPNFIRMYE